jgi:hypothetical protein
MQRRNRKNKRLSEAKGESKMSTQLINNKRFSLTEYCGGKNKVMYQITQTHVDNTGYVQLSEKDIENILAVIKIQHGEEK